jgi:hypothetical protein
LPFPSRVSISRTNVSIEDPTPAFARGAAAPPSVAV